MSFNRYGYEWKDDTPAVDIELYAYRHRGPFTLSQKAHMKRAILYMYPSRFPESDEKRQGKRGYSWHGWTENRLEAWCSNRWQTWWGPSSSGKSTDAGLFALMHWWAAPEETTVIVCSTTKDMLEKRIFGEILRFFQLYEGAVPGTYLKSKHAIVLGDENSKNGIFGIAIQQGTVAQAVGNMVGIHNTYNVLIIDEMQATREAAVEAATNLATGTEFKFLGMGNPESRLDPLGRYSEPLSGWDSVHPDTDDRWNTKIGRTYYYDGLKCPAVTEPDGVEKYPFLLNKVQIDEIAESHGAESFRFWSQRRGFMPPEGMIQTVLTEAMISKFNLKEKAVWDFETFTVAGLDPAFSAGGDKCVLTIARVGINDQRLPCIEFWDSIDISLAVSRDTPIIYHIANEVKRYGELYGFTPKTLAIDDTATQSVADVVEKEWGRGVFRVNFGGKATDLPVSSLNPEKSCEEYKNRVTELWYNVAEFAKFEQIRGLQNRMEVDFTQRVVLLKRPKCVESKGDMRLRTNSSPDTGDSGVCIVAFCRERCGMTPGSPSFHKPQAGFKTGKTFKKMAENAPEAGEQYAEAVYRDGYRATVA